MKINQQTIKVESQNFLDPFLTKPKSWYKASFSKIQIWVKLNRTLITQNPVSIF